MSREKNIIRILVGLAEYYDKSLTETQLAMYTQDLEGLDPRQIELAAMQYRREPKNTRFPLPAALRALIEPETDDHTIAVDLAGRVAAAIEAKGYVWAWNGGYKPHKTFGEAVAADLGTVAWEVIQRYGGWQRIHDAYFDMDRGMFNAVIRERILSTLKLSRAGRLNYRPELPLDHERPSLSERTGPTQIGQVLAKLKERAG